MPNPLIGSRAANVGKRADERPHAMTPRAESYVGDNHPYRGMHDHGVVQHSAPDGMLPDELWEDTTSGVYEPAHEPVEPVPVRVVREFTRELRRFNTSQDLVPVGGVIRQVAGRNPARINITIVNLHATDVAYLMPEQNAGGNAQMGYPLFAGATGKLTLVTQDPIYIVLPVTGANPVPVAVLEEYAVQER